MTWLDSGVRGEILKTPGHSDDSVSLVLDSGMVFVGDLHRPNFVMNEVPYRDLPELQKP